MYMFCVYCLYLSCFFHYFSADDWMSYFFFFKQKTSYEMRISDWSSDVCSSDLSFAPHAPYTVNDVGLERVRMLADQLDIPVHIHVHETAQEVSDAVAKYGMREIARLDRLGLVNSQLIAVHMKQLTDAEIAQIGRAHV